MRKRLSRLLVLSGSAATLLICTSPASAQTENGESKTRLLESYAKAYGVTPAEASGDCDCSARSASSGAS
ncbi:MAG TPA: hypothetical protein VE891_02570 [Allosphingosinicella sp.]|nr:hypothetical protein [Allosphingosinicella sp.]